MKKIVVFLMIISMVVPFPLTELEAEVKELKTFEAGDLIRASEINENFLILREAIEGLNTLLQEKTAEIEARDRTFKLLEQENRIIKEEVTKLKTILEALPEKERIEQLEEMVQEKLAEIEAKTRSLELFEKENQALKKEMTQLKASLKTLLEQSVEQLEAVLEARTADIEVRVRSRERLEAENQTLQEGMTKLEAGIKALKEQSQILAKPEPQVSGEQSETVSPEIPRGTAKEWTDPTTGMEFVWIPEGCFQMGSPENEKSRDDDEGPVHEVCLDGFWMGKYEVTQAQWRQAMGENPSHFNQEKVGQDTSNHPVEEVSWNDVQEFLQKLNKQAGKEMYRLPTEAEWEYAARAGSRTIYNFGDDVDKLGEYAWYTGNSENKTQPVGLLKPNEFGLYDMHGNVWELCQDGYDSNSYSKGFSKNPQDNSLTKYRVLRGGAWSSNPDLCRSANRGWYPSDGGGKYYGFRMVVDSTAVQYIPISTTNESKSKEWTDLITGMEFVWIPEGCFQMGSPRGEEERGDDEGPVHEICLDGFWMGKYEVTQAQWEQVMGENPSNFKGENLPVEKVSWNDVQEFLQKLNEQAGKEMYRLPTEAEWEYTARAGTETAYSFGDDAYKLDEYAWYKENSGGKTRSVGQLKPNAWGVYDMHGNVWEWCQDWYGDKYYWESPSSPQGPSSGKSRIRRGGSWLESPHGCRSANRSTNSPNIGLINLGFRVVVDSAAMPYVPTATPEEPESKEWTDPTTGMEFVWIPEGCFQMGSPEDEEGRDSDEGPVHEICLDGFWMGKCEVTQAQWEQVMGENPSNFKGENLPVQRVSWNDVQEFLQKLNEEAVKEMYRLPTEAEWEYAARAGTETAYSFGDDAEKLDEYAWYSGNSDRKAHPVGQLRPNAWDLYDMHGNVREWCQDWYNKEYYSKSSGENPLGPVSGSGNIVRGGNWRYDAGYCRSASRGAWQPSLRLDSVGFRLVRSPL